jgi:hypothetical protein
MISIRGVKEKIRMMSLGIMHSLKFELSAGGGGMMRGWGPRPFCILNSHLRSHSLTLYLHMYSSCTSRAGIQIGSLFSSAVRLCCDEEGELGCGGDREIAQNRSQGPGTGFLVFGPLYY